MTAKDFSTLVNGYEIQGRYVISCLKAGEYTTAQACDLLENLCVDYLYEAKTFNWWQRLRIRWQLVAMRDRLIIKVLSLALPAELHITK